MPPSHGKDGRPIPGRQRQRALKSPALQKLHAMTLHDAEGARMPRNRRRAGEEAVEDQPLVRAQCRRRRLRQLALEVRAHPSHGALDLLQVARRLPHQLTIDRLDVGRGLLE